MKEKTRKILGWFCLIYSGFLLLLHIFIIVVAAKLEIHEIGWKFILESIVLAVWFGALGFNLVRGKSEQNMKMRFLTYALLLFPLLILRTGVRIEPLKLRADWLPLVSVILVIFSIISLFVPYLFGDRILGRIKEKSLNSSATPPQMLHLIGMFWSLVPSIMGFCLYLLGSSKDTVYYLVGISYLAIGGWWAWWKHRYSQASSLV